MRLDNRSQNETALMFAILNLLGGGEPNNSAVFDVSQYDLGYTIIANVVNVAAGTFNFEIQTSDSSGSGFANVPSSKLVGGAIPNPLDNVVFTGPGGISFTRGVVDNKPFVRVRFSNFTSLPGNIGAFVTINGALEVAPSKLSPGTVIAVA